jgi:hypothetical protein
MAQSVKRIDEARSPRDEIASVVTPDPFIVLARRRRLEEHIATYRRER